MIIMKNKSLMILCGLLASLFIGCEDLKFGDNFLEKPNSDDVSIDTVFSSKKYADQARNQFYKSLWDFMPTLRGCHPEGLILDGYTDIGYAQPISWTRGDFNSSSSCINFPYFPFHSQIAEVTGNPSFGIRKAYIYIENVDKAVRALNSMLMLINKGEQLTQQNVRYVLTLVNEGNEDKISSMGSGSICISSKGRPVKPKTLGQKKYCDAIMNNTITFGIGPAGTGKTYLAVAMAVTAFRAKEVDRIILTRPAVEAGEKLGFLPGDLQSKVDPYLRPLYDALFDMLGAESFQRYQERGAIEVAPLAYMRGRTLDDSFIILDEAQNTTPEQMKMFLTRLGFNSKMVITGDITQIDLPDGKKSGLKKVMHILRNVNDIAICKFDKKDVVRHKLVQDIVNAYQKYEEDKNNGRS